MANILSNIEDCRIIDFVAGSKFNVIPSKAKTIIISTESEQDVEKLIQDYIISRKDIFSGIEASVKLLELDSYCALNEEESKRFINNILRFSHGVFRRNSKEEIITSINLGEVNLIDQVFKVGMRSSRKREEKECLEYIKNYSEFVVLGSQPGFETKSSSEFLKTIKEAYKKIGNEEELKVKSVHITVEAGFFRDKIEGLEIAIISPKIENAHTPEECVEIESIRRCDEWIRRVIES